MRAALLTVALAGCTMVRGSGGGTIASGGAVGAPSGTGTTSAPVHGKVIVPSFAGKTEAEARQAFRAAGFQSELEVNSAPLECDGAVHEDGRVDCQDPEPGTSLDRAAIVRIDVFHGHGHPGVLTRDDTSQLIGMTLAQAKKQLASHGFHGQIDVSESRDLDETDCAYDTVCEVIPADFQLDAPITLRVSKAKLEIAPPAP